MQFERRCPALRQSIGASDLQREPGRSVAPAPLRALVPAAPLLGLLVWLGVVPLPVGTVAPAEAQSCSSPAFWNPFAPGGGRCEVYMCAEGFTLDGNGCKLNGRFASYAASCPVGWGVRAVDLGIHGYQMRCVDPSPPAPPPPRSIVRRRAPDPPPVRVDDDPGVVAVTRVRGLPFTVSESGASEKSYKFSVTGASDVSVSLTGMDRDIDCRVNGSRCTNRGGTADDSWSGRLSPGTHTVTVYPYRGGSGSWTLKVRGTSASPPPAPSPPPPPGPAPPPPPTCPSGYSYVAAASRCERSQSFRMQAVETGISGSRSYSFTLRAGSGVTVSLTGLTRDFDCRVNGSRCTNNWHTADDSWSGTLGAGTHTVLVYPYGGGGVGDYTLTVAVNDVNLVSVVSPTGSGPEEIVCNDGNGNEIDCPAPDETLDVESTPIPVPRIEDPGPPPGAGPGESDPGPGQPPDTGDGGGGGGGGGSEDDDETPSTQEQLANAVADALERLEACRVYNDLRERGGSIAEYDPSSHISAANVLDEIPHEGPSCSHPDEPYAHVNQIPGGTEIHICPAFYSLTPILQSRTIIHEGLHLMGYRHRDFLLPDGEPAQDGRQMNEAISASCYAE